MNLRKFSFFWLTTGGYAIVVILFAFLYLMAWDGSPDSFIINEQFNIFPVNQLRQLLSQPSEFPDPLRLQEGVYQSASVQNAVEGFRKEKNRLDVEEKMLKQRLSTQQAVEQQASKENDAIWQKNVDNHRNSEFITILGEGAKLTNAAITASRELDKVTNVIERLPLVIANGEATLKLAEFRVRQANKEFEVSSQIVKNYGSFRDPALEARLTAINADIHIIESEIRTNLTAQSDFRSKVWNYADSLRMQHINRLGFADFIYFSLGVSTTTTFGDMIPNSRYVRLLVIVQLVTCIVIVGLFVTHIGNKILPKN